MGISDNRAVNEARRNEHEHESGSADQQVFFREVAVDEFGLAARRLFSTFFRWRCPACAVGTVSKGLLSVRESCDYCGSNFARLEGNLLISISLSFFLVSVVTFFAGLVIVLNYGFIDNLMWWLLGLGLATVAVGYKPVWVFSIFLLWMLGFVYPDRVPKGKSTAPRRQPEAVG